MTLTERLTRLRRLVDAVAMTGAVGIQLVCMASGWFVLASCEEGELPPLFPAHVINGNRFGGGWLSALGFGADADEAIYDAEQRVSGIVEAWIHQMWIPDSSASEDDAELLHHLLFTMGPLPSKHPEADDHDS